MTKDITKVTVADIRKEAKAQAEKPKKQESKTEPIAIIKQDDLVPMQESAEAKIDEYLFSYIPKKHKEHILSIYKDGKNYVADIDNGKRVEGITNWDSFKRAIRRAIEY